MKRRTVAVAALAAAAGVATAYAAWPADHHPRSQRRTG